MTQKLQTRTVFVAGGTGKTGRRVAARLAGRDVEVRVGSRHQAVPFDWNRPDAWDDALGAWVDSAYVAYSPDLAVPGAAEQVGAFPTGSATSPASRAGTRGRSTTSPARS